MGVSYTAAEAGGGGPTHENTPLDSGSMVLSDLVHELRRPMNSTEQITDSWIPVCEQMPPEGETVIVCQTGIEDTPCIFAGWIQTITFGDATTTRWFRFDSKERCLCLMGDVRATDFWLTLPTCPPDFGAVRVIYPA